MFYYYYYLANYFQKLHTIGSDEHVTCAVYNYNGTEILASYKDEDIYLFDVASPQPEECLPVHKYQGHRNNATGMYRIRRILLIYDNIVKYLQ